MKFPESALVVEIVQVILGIATLVCGTYAASFLTGTTNENKGTILGFWVFWMGLFCGIGLIVYGFIVSFMI